MLGALGFFERESQGEPAVQEGEVGKKPLLAEVEKGPSILRCQRSA
jgi:hypothetical protein